MSGVYGCRLHGSSATIFKVCSSSAFLFCLSFFFLIPFFFLFFLNSAVSAVKLQLFSVGQCAIIV